MAEEIAKQQTDTMSKDVSLTEKQYKKIYKVYLSNAQVIE